MSCIEGFVLAVPTANRDAFVAHARLGDAVFVEHGAARVVEAWQEDVRRGHTTDFFGAVEARDDESVVFSWIEWPERARRDAMQAGMDAIVASDPRFDPARNPMPFDGARMIHGCFAPLVDEGTAVAGGYAQGFVVPVPEANRDAYRAAALAMWDILKDHGACRVVEAWPVEVPHGRQTDFFRAVKAEPGEVVVFSFIEWPSRAVCDAAQEAMMQDERMQAFGQAEGAPPFDGRRMVYGGFCPIVELTANPAGE